MPIDASTHWYAGLGWLLWFAMIVLILTNFGQWGTTYRFHRLFREGFPSKDALDILSERYARGEVTSAEFAQMKSEILECRAQASKSNHLSKAF
jgi:uncharacterized membrane protein